MRPSPSIKRPWKSGRILAEAHNNLGLALASLGRFDEALAHYRKALEIKPDYAEVHHNLGIILAGKGRFDDALAHYQKALEIKPDFVEARNNLAWLRATCPDPSLRNGVEAIELARQTIKLTGDKNPVVLAALAAAYAEAGRFPEAAAAAQSPGACHAAKQPAFGGRLAESDQAVRSGRALS